ncbi:NUDIX hydrolase [Sporosarcina pasteurii]|uniref:ADP-ribose pyrophosphatase n=1 Tax=Sporosarcina pasteurii TaxID=1474 RepID=A0A380BJ61_SPOPA|nr:NUDIX hydrolase [Sporosarcina pasteurii]MDS9470772.1 NUDIX hydrolase [Sporosarcina pasteurii]QBQ05558.1 NUDIX hydrolase [Sporosarcina pasteurii]SUJ02238.1 ADP-ribose pyrophosphatase [Sporosarcina pasteurii]
MKSYEEKTIATNSIYEGKIISLQVDDVELPDGNHAKRELVKHPGAVALIPITDEGKIIVVKQYRKAIERAIVEIPAGRIEPNEDPKLTAIRELEEETGYGTHDITYLQSFATSPGFADEIIHLYVAKDLYKIEDPAEGDEDEFIERLEVSIEEAEKMVATGEIYDAKTAFAILYVKHQLNM